MFNSSAKFDFQCSRSRKHPPTHNSRRSPYLPTLQAIEDVSASAASLPFSPRRPYPPTQPPKPHSPARKHPSARHRACWKTTDDDSRRWTICVLISTRGRWPTARILGCEHHRTLAAVSRLPFHFHLRL